MKKQIENLLGLDVGTRKIGVARVSMIARVPEPLTVLANDNTFSGRLQALVDQHQADALVVGLPRNLNGQETAQSAYTRQFVSDHLQEYQVFWQDETLSSVSGQQNLEYYGQKDSRMLDAVAACIILEDYIRR